MLFSVLPPSSFQQSPCFHRKVTVCRSPSWPADSKFNAAPHVTFMEDLASSSQISFLLFWCGTRSPFQRASRTPPSSRWRHSLYSFARAAITKTWVPCAADTYRLTGLEAGSLTPRCWQTRFLLWAVKEGSVPGFPPWLVDGCLFLVCSPHLPLACVHVQISPFCKGTSHIGSGLILMTSF